MNRTQELSDEPYPSSPALHRLAPYLKGSGLSAQTFLAGARDGSIAVPVHRIGRNYYVAAAHAVEWLRSIKGDVK